MSCTMTVHEWLQPLLFFRLQPLTPPQSGSTQWAEQFLWWLQKGLDFIHKQWLCMSVQFLLPCKEKVINVQVVVCSPPYFLTLIGFLLSTNLIKGGHVFGAYLSIVLYYFSWGMLLILLMDPISCLWISSLRKLTLLIQKIKCISSLLHFRLENSN